MLRQHLLLGIAVWSALGGVSTGSILSNVEQSERVQKWAGDWSFSGPLTFAKLPSVRCLVNPRHQYDIAIIGVPFDTATSYRPGARFGPRGIRLASARQSSWRGVNPRAGINPYRSWARVLDCSDIPVTPLDNALAFRQMTEAFLDLGDRQPAYTPRSPETAAFSVDESYVQLPKLIALGGDHSVALPALRALRKLHGQPIAVLHFDAHLDTWAHTPSEVWQSDQEHLNHGSVFWAAGQEGLLRTGSCVHAGLRSRLTGDDMADYGSDSAQGWLQIEVDEIDELGHRGLAERIVEHIGLEVPVYLSIDVDVLDPAFAPGTGTPEPGGWTTRDLIKILRAVDGLNIVGADVVEVAPAYDSQGDATSLAAAHIVFEILTSMVKRGLRRESDAPRSQESANIKEEL